MSNTYYEHDHTVPDCYKYTWTLVWKTYSPLSVAFTGVANSEGISVSGLKESAKHNEAVTFALTLPADADKTVSWTAKVGESAQKLEPGVATEFTATITSGTIAVELSNEEVPTYSITLVEKNGTDGCSTTFVGSTTNLLAGATVGVTVEVPDTTNIDNISYTPVVKVTGGDATYADGVLTVGTTDVELTVDYGYKELSGKDEAKVEFDANYAGKVNEMDAAALKTLREEIFKQLDVKSLPDGATAENVTIEYKADGNYTGDYLFSDWFELNESNPTYTFGLFGRDITINLEKFGKDGLGSTETVRISYNGLSIEAEITLTDYFTITWVNGDETTYSYNVEYGTTAEALAAMAPTLSKPDKVIDGNVAATYEGTWGTLAEVTGDATYTATYNEVAKKYTITWLDDAGNLIDTTEVAYGTVPTHADPTKAATAQYTYTFAGWDTEPVAVTGNATYKATFNQTVNKYTITWLDDVGGLIDTTEVEYGTVPTHADPTKAADETYTYTFAGWDTEPVAVTGDATYTATFTPAYIEYKINWDVRGTVTTVTLHYGNTITAPVDPEGYQDGDKQFVFDGWDYNGDGYYNSADVKPETVTGNATFTAIFRADNEVAAVEFADSTVSYYTTVAEAMAAAQEGDTVKLLKDASVSSATVAEGTKITIDLNGKTLTMTPGWGEYAIKVAGELTIQGEGNVILEPQMFVGFGISVQQSGKLTLNTNGSYSIDGISGVIASVNGELVVNSGEFTGNSNTSLFNTGAEAKVTITGGSFDPVPLEEREDDTRTIAISGGTYSSDFPKEWLVKAYKLVENDDGTWSVALKDVYTVTFIFGNGEEDVVIEVYEGDSFEAPANPTWENHYFNGWDKEIVTTPTESVTYTAQWFEDYNGNGQDDEDEAHYTVTYVDGNGNVLATFEEVLVDLKTPTIADPTLNNFKFNGWDPEVAESVTADVTYTAQWVNDINNNGVDDEEETVEVTIEGNGTVNGNTETFTVIYDSTEETTVSINAVPAIEEGSSKSYISSITANGVEQTLVYADDCSITLDAPVEGHSIVVTFTDCGFVYDEDGEMRFYVGMETPQYEMLYNAVIVSPEYSAEFVESVKYLARPAATYQMQVPVLFQYTVPIINYEIKIGGNTVDIDLDDAWLDVGEEFKTLTPEELQKQYDTEIQKIKDKIAAIDLSDVSWNNAWDKVQQFAAITEELNTLIETLSNEAQYMGFHQFGASGLVDENGNVQEILQVIYDNGAMRLVDDEVYVTLVDDRIATTITGGDLTFEYDEFTDEDIMNALVLTDVDGNVIAGELIKYVDLVGMEVGTRTYSVTYGGSWDYKPCTVEFTLTVVKAPSNTDVLNQNITYGEKLSAPVITNKHGVAINIDTIEFIIGLDIADLDVDGDGVKGLEGRMQLILTEELQTILSMVGLEEGAELNISELISMLTNTGLLEQWGVSSEMVDVLKQALDAINGVVEANNLLITIGGEYPTDIGAYLHGAVTVDANYETSFDVGYIIIKPDASRVYLDWNFNDTNGVYTPELLQHINLGASAFDEAEFLTRNDEASQQINNLFFGLDINGELVAKLYNTDVDSETFENELDNGAYTQMAFIAEFGNEFYYAVPIVRAFAIVPNVVDVEIVVDGAEAADSYITVFDNEPVDVEAILTYTQGAELLGNGEVTFHYYGIKTNTNTYDSDVAPTNAGAYAVTATYISRDEYGKVVAMGMDVATLLIMPAESSVIVDEKVVTVDENAKYDLGDLVHAESKTADITPDTTVISASVATDGTFSETAWEAVVGAVNVDFPAWVDAIITQYAPSVVDGITVDQLQAKLLDKLPDLSAKLAELGATEEMVNSFNNLMGNVTAALDNVPSDVELSFKDNVSVTNVGVYLVAAVVTDSDHIPSADVGYLVIAPDVTEVKLDWNYEDDNDIWTSIKLETEDLFATAYDKETGLVKDEEATAKITYQFIGVNAAGEPVIYTFGADDDTSVLPNGVYTEVAYIELEIDGKMFISDLIARPVVLVATPTDVIFVDETGAENNDRHFIFDNTAKEMPVQITVSGSDTVIVPADGEVVYTYVGVQTNGKEYVSNTAPVQAGAYAVTAVYTSYDANGELDAYGMAVGAMVIEPAASTIEVTGGTVTYDGNGHTATVEAGSVTSSVSPDYTLISGGAYVSGDIDEIGVDAFHGNVNIDFPRWLDEALAEDEFKTEGVDTAYLIDFITSYRDDLIGLIPVDELVALGADEAEINSYIEKLDAYIDELLDVLEKLPTDVALTFNDGVTYTEPGYYFYYGIVTDSDHYPSTDTGLLVIEKKPITFDLVDTTVAWDGEGHMTNVTNPNSADDVTVIIDRENNTVNILMDEDAQYLINTVARILDVEFDGDVQMSTIIEKYNGEELAAAIVELIGELEKLELPEDVQKALAAVKTELESLPENGTVTVNGALPAEIGTYEVYAVSYSQYYQTATSEAVLEIVPVQVEVILDDNSKFFGEEDPELTYTVKYYDHEGNELADADVAKVTVSRVPGEDVDEYDITAKVELTDEHYVLMAEPEKATFTINPAQITIEVADASKVYGEDDPENEPVVTVNKGVVDLDVVLTREEGEDVGTYAYDVTYTESENYIVTEEIGSLTITPAQVAITVADQTKVYGDADPTVTPVVNVTSGAVTAEELGVSVTREEGDTVAGSPYDYIVAYNESDNYEVTVTAGALTVTPAEVTITMDDQTKVYGESDPTEWTYTVTGLKNGDEASVLNIAASREVGQDVGTYAITATASNSNYDINIVNGTLTITKKDATITVHDKTMVAGNEVPELTADVEGMVGDETLNYTLSTKDPVAIGEHGTYDIVATLGDNPNYNVTVKNGTLTVAECALTVDGVAYTGWAEALADINNGVSEIKLYTDVRYYDVSNKNQTRFSSNNDITVDLNGYALSFYGTVNVNPGTELNVVGEGSLTMEHKGWPLVMANNNTVKIADTVEFSGSIQMNNKAKSNYYYGDDCVIGNSDEAIFQTTGDSNYVVVKFADGFMDLILDSGHLTLTKDLETLDGQKVTINVGNISIDSSTGLPKAPSILTIPEGITLTLDPGTTLVNKGTVDGEGTIAVASVEHLALALATDIKNVKLVGSDEDAAAELVSDGSVTVDLNKQSMTVGSVTVNGSMIIKDTASGDASADAGKLLGDITVAEGASLTLYAGTYSEDVQDYVAEGYYAHDNGDGTWTVLEKIDLNEAVHSTVMYYNGTAQAPAAEDFEVTDENGNKVDPADYTVQVTDQTDAGTYSVTILATGRAYTGSVETTWTIAPAEVTVTVDSIIIDVDDVPELTHTATVTAPGAVTAEELGVVLSVDITKNAAGQNVLGEYNIVVDYTESANWNVAVVDGTVTVELGEDFICWNVQTGEYFNDVSDALDKARAEAGEETIQMLADATDAANDKDELIVIVYNGTTFDLNGYYVETANMLSYGDVIDTDENSGGIVIDSDTSKAFTQLQPGNTYLPVYDAANGCYRFFLYGLQRVRTLETTNANGAAAVQFRFRIRFHDADAYSLLANGDTGVKMQVKLFWDGLLNEIIYTMDAETLTDYAKAAYEEVLEGDDPYAEINAVMFLTVGGVDRLSTGAVMRANPTVVTVSDAGRSTADMTHTVE